MKDVELALRLFAGESGIPLSLTPMKSCTEAVKASSLTVPAVANT